ncbi:glycoside hydrolase family 31 protein [Sediminispirochaeta smaragdinae]|uniref:Glycoside hydrolase family 31 n=1 Tax=Sediminispirochaeta smaragdinae (strain DSM 11293 / JCM 15392 / SEBR 4228) TaxID=573413 RepID=E1RCI0_SEDSS|nr:TIM-barrel domain-containing protein [Sediminispirochaeta smaragdinae]ADK80060.1 glycoside hydrolase family 31 [Sediminispirochaeta smaragdinae DSM 11293]
MNNVSSDLIEALSANIGTSLKSAGALRSYDLSTDRHAITFDFEEAELMVQPREGGLVELTVSCHSETEKRPFPARSDRSWAVEEKPAPLSVTAGKQDNLVTARWEGGHVEVESASGAMTICDADGRVVFDLADGAVMLSPTLSGLTFLTQEEEQCFGLGEKSGNLDRRGRTYQMWNSDEPRHTPERDPLYVSIPLLYRHTGDSVSALFLDEPGKSWFDLADSRSDRCTVAAPLSRLRFYLWSGATIADAFAHYSRLTGKPPLPPLWSLGYHQSRYSYFTEEEVTHLAETFRQKAIPCDVIHLDIDYMEGYKVFTWNGKSFPNPRKLLAQLREKGFRVVTIIDPGVGSEEAYAVFRDGIDKGYFLEDKDGKPYIGKVWPGKAAFPDFTREEPRRWWSGHVKQHMELGVSGIWNDMNEPADFTGDPYDRSNFTLPDSVRSVGDDREVPFVQLHNVFGQGMCKATRAGIQSAKPNERPFVLSRAGYAGIQRYAALWTGDNNSWWEHMAMSIPMLTGLGISGVPFVGSDAGGFQSNASGELFARWLAYAAFTPFFRGHSNLGTRSHEPWAFGSEVERAAKLAIERRYRFLPYTYSLFHEAAETGAPIMRPLFWEFPKDPRCRTVSDQYLFGPSLIVAPILTPGARARSVYLPEGIWEEVESGKRYLGGQDILVTASLDQIPLFVRTGTILPMCKVAQHTTDAWWNPLQLHLFLPSRKETFGESSCIIREDDGASILSGDKTDFRTSRAVLKRSSSSTLHFSLATIEGAGPEADIEFYIHRGEDHPTEVIEIQRGAGPIDFSL